MTTLAIVGATGLVGQECLACLEEDDHFDQHISSLRLIASSQSAGKTINYRGITKVVEDLATVDFSEIDIAIFGVGTELSEKYVKKAAAAGCIAIDNSSAFRYVDEIPLVVPEVNADDLRHHHGIIANPNCSTAQLMVAIAPIHRHTPIQRMIVSTYQSASGAGLAGEEALLSETQTEISRKDFQSSHYTSDSTSPNGPHARKLAFNVIPHIDVFLENGYTREEMKIVWETRKILHAPEMEISATAVRVPVFRGHSEAVTLDLAAPLDRKTIVSLLENEKGLRILDSVNRNDYPTPLDCAGDNDTWVGRLRIDPDRPSTVHLWVVSDNLRKGAAKNALQIAEKVLEMM